MDKESYQPMTIGHVAKRGTERDFFSIFGAESGIGERGENILKQWRVFRERKCNFFLDFPAFGPSSPSSQEAKLFYVAKATRGHQFFGVSTTPRGRGLLQLGYFRF